MKYVNVILPIPVDKCYTYRVDSVLENDILPGQVVLAPLRNRVLSGLVVDVLRENEVDSSINYQDILDIIELTPFYNKSRLKLLEWMASYYMTPLGEVFQKTLTPGLSLKSKTLVTLLSPEFKPETQNLSETEHTIIEILKQAKKNSLAVGTLRKKSNIKNIIYHLKKLQQKGIVDVQLKMPPSKKAIRKEIFYTLSEATIHDDNIKKNIRPNATNQNLVIDLLHRQKSPIPRKYFTSALNIPSSVLSTLESRGIIKMIEIEEDVTKKWKMNENLTRIELSEEQNKIAVQLDREVESNSFSAMLLWGITGSGKTQIYIHLAKRIIEKGKSVLILLPEISLTPQILSRFEFYLNKKIYVYHSMMSESERLHVWNKVANDPTAVVVGVRSAIFLPLNNLGAVIIDEEHETSFKNTDSMPTYHARDVAFYLARMNNAIFLAGSATPSLESVYLAKNDKMKLSRLTKRVKRGKLPKINIIDLKSTPVNYESDVPFSESLILEIQARLLAREQVLLFKNLRGFSPYVYCSDCNEPLTCTSCDISLTFHHNSSSLKCHYCGYEIMIPQHCPNCRSFNLQKSGAGTERIESAIKKLFPEANVIRLDRDTTGSKENMIAQLERMKEGKADILIGTKMITKGLDFENVTLVGILDGDMDFSFPDFRAQEKGFQTLLQVIGRGGRGDRSAMAIIQTRNIESPVFKMLRSNEYSQFVEEELKIRNKLAYPPYYRIILVEVTSRNYEKGFSVIEGISKNIRKILHPGFLLLGPVEAPKAKLKDRFRFHLIMKSPRNYDRQLVQVKHQLKNYLINIVKPRFTDIDIKIDVDPVDLM